MICCWERFFFFTSSSMKLKEDKLWIRFFPLFSLALFFIHPKTSLTAFLCFSFPASLPAHSLIYTPNYWILYFLFSFFLLHLHTHTSMNLCALLHTSVRTHEYLTLQTSLCFLASSEECFAVIFYNKDNTCMGVSD